MKIRILGAGWYGCHLGTALIAAGHDVEIFDQKPEIFQGASGKIPARMHIGAHYPRSHQTREACQRHTIEFMRHYGHLTRGVQKNLYAVAADHSLVDFDQYVATLRGEFQFITVYDPAEYGLQNVEGAILCGERHIVSRAAKAHFEWLLKGKLRLGVPTPSKSDHYDLTIDCTFCAQDAAGVDRYEPCLVLLLKGPTDQAVTIMDGPFGSLYPWDQAAGLCSLSSAQWTPFSKTIKTYAEAQAVIADTPRSNVLERSHAMIDQMRHYYPAIDAFELVEPMLSIRAMPLSGADTRLVSVVRADDRLLRVRAGKIDAVLDAEKLVMEMIDDNRDRRRRIGDR